MRTGARFITLLLVLMVLAAVSVNLPALPQSRSPKAPAQPALDERSRLAMDSKVLESALHYLMSDSAFNETLLYYKQPDIVLSAQLPEKPPSYGIGLATHPDLAKSIPSEAMKDLLKRNAGSAQPRGAGPRGAHPRSWTEFHPNSKRILIAPEVRQFGAGAEGWVRFRKMYPRAKGFISAWLPGYGPNAQSAVLHFTVGPNAHGGFGSCLVTNSRGIWNVQWCHIDY